MSWRTAAAVIIAIFAFTVIWVTLADPLIQLQDAFLGIGGMSGQFGYTSLIKGMVGTWFNMILLGVFGIMAWGVWRVWRNEVTRGGI